MWVTVFLSADLWWTRNCKSARPHKRNVRSSRLPLPDWRMYCLVARSRGQWQTLPSCASLPLTFILLHIRCEEASASFFFFNWSAQNSKLSISRFMRQIDFAVNCMQNDSLLRQRYAIASPGDDFFRPFIGRDSFDYISWRNHSDKLIVWYAVPQLSSNHFNFVSTFYSQESNNFRLHGQHFLWWCQECDELLRYLAARPFSSFHFPFSFPSSDSLCN